MPNVGQWWSNQTCCDGNSFQPKRRVGGCVTLEVGCFFSHRLRRWKRCTLNNGISGSYNYHNYRIICGRVSVIIRAFVIAEWCLCMRVPSLWTYLPRCLWGCDSLLPETLTNLKSKLLNVARFILNFLILLTFESFMVLSKSTSDSQQSRQAKP